ncbi:MAG: tRNA pseudouridine(13) synthase TruD [Gammaproteobacteria bacterium]|nr:tRNA pseudouridine(13) synthase TruD [Gammaproteobacteria bacterium]
MPGTDTTLPDWARAHGSPVFRGVVKQSPNDFKVDEVLGFAPTGDGEHDFLLVEKTDANTAWVARGLAAHGSVNARDAGFAGLKDRRAVTTQWFSVRRPSGAGTDWRALDLPGVRILEQTRHNRKLKRGAHAANRFRIVIRFADINKEGVIERLESICAVGVPNYFGPQRFGRNASNLVVANAVFKGKRVNRDQRSMAISAARSYIFNEVLSARVSAGTWNQVLVGEPLNLDSTGSYFVPNEVDRQLKSRLRSFDIHPTGPLWGKDDSRCSGAAAEIEQAVADANPDFVTGLRKVGARTDRRALRMPVHDCSWHISAESLELAFRLGKGSFATAVLRELMTTADE